MSFAGSLGVLVTIQLLMALSVANLVARHDSPPSFLIWPLQGSLGNFLCLSDLPLVGQVCSLMQAFLIFYDKGDTIPALLINPQLLSILLLYH